METSIAKTGENLTKKVQQQELFKDVDFTVIEPILNDCPVLKIKQNETLIEVGEANHNLYLILSGRLRVHLSNDQENPVAILEAGENVGEVSIIDQQPTSACVIADTDSELMIIEENNLWQLVELSHAIARNLLLVLSQRLRYGNSMINKIKELVREYEYNATIDPLTSLYNRRWLDNMLARVMQRCQTNNQTLSVIMLDIDYFKQYNDENGHLAGDCALRVVSRTVLQNLRPEDMVTRYGGEELFALLPGLNLMAARQVAERLRDAIAKTEIIMDDGTLLPSLTISAGITEMQDSYTPDKLIQAADEAMYRGKKAGRNTISQ